MGWWWWCWVSSRSGWLLELLTELTTSANPSNKINNLIYSNFGKSMQQLWEIQVTNKQVSIALDLLIDKARQWSGMSLIKMTEPSKIWSTAFDLLTIYIEITTTVLLFIEQSKKFRNKRTNYCQGVTPTIPDLRV